METTNDKEYWNKAEEILFHLAQKKDVFFEVDERLKRKVLKKIKFSINKFNYQLVKLIVYSKIDEDILLNFLFYKSINKEISYNLFLRNPDKYGTTFIFNLHPKQLPEIKNILSKEELLYLKTELKIAELVIELEGVTKEELEKKFPKTFKKFSKINPFIEE